MEEYLLTFFKALGMFAIGLLAFRIMGSQSIGRLTDFDLVVVIAIGALIGDVLADHELDPWITVVAIAGLVLAQVITSLLAMNHSWFEKIVTGKPIRLIANGRVLKNGLRRARLTKNNLLQELRIKGLESSEQVETAFMEPGGKVSVIEKKNT